MHFGHDNFDLYDLVATRAFFGGRGDALLAQSQSLPALSSGRNFELGAPIHGGHFDLGAQRGLTRSNRHGDVNVIAFAAKHRMLARAHDNVKIAGRAAMAAGIAFAGQAYALAIARSGLDAHGERLGATDHAFAVTDVADSSRMSGAAAARAGDVEFHAPGSLRHLSGAFAFRADAGGLEISRAAAVRANILAHNVQPQLGAANRLPESRIDLIFEIGALFRAGFGDARAAASAKDS